MKEKLMKFLGVSETTKDEDTSQMLRKLDGDTNKIVFPGLEMLRDDFQANYFWRINLSSQKMK
jgi:hypothetical protein